MNMSARTHYKTVHKKEINVGVMIIFIIVTVMFLLSLTLSNYSKELFSSQKTEFRK